MHAFCWDPSKASEQEKLNHYADCSGAVCQKAVQIDGGGKCYNTIPPNNFRKKYTFFIYSFILLKLLQRWHAYVL